MSVAASDTRISLPKQTPKVEELKRIAGMIEALCDSSEGASDALVATLREVRTATSEPNAVSTYEFTRSGIVAPLVRLFLNAPNADVRRGRVLAFCTAFFEANAPAPPLKSTPQKEAKEGAAVSMLSRELERATQDVAFAAEPGAGAVGLAQQLNQVLDKEGQFAVTATDLAATQRGLSMLVRSVKLRMRRRLNPVVEGHRAGDFAGNTALIEPLATFASINSFMCGRLLSDEQAPADADGGGMAVDYDEEDDVEEEVVSSSNGSDSSSDGEGPSADVVASPGAASEVRSVTDHGDDDDVRPADPLTLVDAVSPGESPGAATPLAETPPALSDSSENTTPSSAPAARRERVALNFWLNGHRVPHSTNVFQAQTSARAQEQARAAVGAPRSSTRRITNSQPCPSPAAWSSSRNGDMTALPFLKLARGGSRRATCSTSSGSRRPSSARRSTRRR